ncbi:MAG: PD-(D/E)XK nuclease family protein [Lentimicrobium sp.]|nr:PD-(D/E)XK nuclease family protein [Lentimicrobium sp.]
MNQPFLKSIAEHIKENYPGLGNRLCVVMPNRRAGLFLKQYLAPADNKPIWAPDIYSIEDFVSQLTGFTIPDPLSQMSALYTAHCRINGANAQAFDDFIGWSKGLIRDFEETDQYLIDPSVLFNHLSETRALSLWNMGERPLTDFEQNYLQFYRSLTKYYELYREILTEKHLAYHGFACRLLAENPQKYINDTPWHHIVFAGFNAITPAQLKILGYFIESGKGEMRWDADDYYMSNKNQEAGFFLRRHMKDSSLGSPGEVSEHFKSSERNIHIAGIPRQVGQTLLAGSLISELISGNGPEILAKTAIVLADETLLIPLLNAIPPEAGQFNVTMGFPLMHSPLFNLFDAILEMHINASVGKNEHQRSYYHKNLLQVLQHSHMQYLAPPEAIKELTGYIRNLKRAFIGIDDLKQIPQQNAFLEIAALIMKKAENAVELIHQLQELIAGLKNALAGDKKTDEAKTSPETEILFNIALIFNRLETIAGEAGLIESLRTLRKLFREAAQAMPVAFYGEPLKGIQVMGMLETRALDFENIIMLSVNEDKLPLGKNFISFIPVDIRHEFDLPTHQHQQAVYAYHFYRLLQRAKNIWLIYNSEAEDMGGGEKSRFISQIIQELPVYSKLNHISEIGTVNDTRLNRSSALFIEKNEIVFSRLLELAEKGLSPTTLNQYLTCPLRFYFSTVLGLGETEEIEETIDFRTLGTVVHEVLQDFYSPFKGSFPLKHDFRLMLEKAPEAIASTMLKHYPGGDIKSGRNLLIVKVAETWIRRFIEMEASGDFRPEKGDYLLFTEKKMESKIQIKTADNHSLGIKIKGTADRIDTIAGIRRIIDYKTGKVEARELKIKSVNELFEPSAKQKEKAFQLMFYLLLANKDEENGSDAGITQAGIISFRSIQSGFRPLEITEQDNSSAMAEFEAGLIKLCNEIFDPETAFTQTNRKEDCYLCPFKGICHKTEEKKGW